MARVGNEHEHEHEHEMLTRRIIPCLDVRAGRVVKGTRFEGLVDQGDPVERARAYQAQGADEIVILDIVATVEDRLASLPVIERCADVLSIPLTVGGGVRSIDDVRALLAAGADKVGINSAAVRDPAVLERAAREFGSQCVVLAIDAAARPEPVEGRTFEVVIDGGRTPTGKDAVAWAAEAVRRGAGEILLTSIDRDGTGEGFDIELTRAVSRAVPVPVIASGGGRAREHFLAVLTGGCADAALAAGIFHRGEMTIHDLKSFLSEKGVPIRPPS